MDRIVVDTNVLVSAALSEGGVARAVLHRCLRREAVPLIGQALFTEYEDVFARDALFARSPLSRQDREALLDAVLVVCRWTRVSFLWRPKLRDEADNHFVELAVAGAASAIVTGNARDLATGELRLGRLRVLSPAAYLASHPAEEP